ncbi:hypothetical protein Val02_35760 [Virgisporangium aliadipatigenens]|uniref:Phosphatidic acid phosphatase type 2/haloperoxidase domain-containing protein n=1 Tax=Virgisporangium aliadipatigenens TaxID=741659 RepID=A0A8J4DQ57_9ACTN|nr:vanadium-dependent haloperoxidase [Virgisporangium aliadipatigenens]GIJ46690.1 hypothetical protein Val02_35760 [Virgisporangium aliadipatigenens]
MKRQTTVSIAVLLAALSPMAMASAVRAAPTEPAATTNAVIRWDLNTQTAVWDIGQQLPWFQGRSFAMVSGAVYDAVNAIAGTPYKPLLVAPRATGRESTDAAVATAAYRVLDDIFPAQAERLRAQYDQDLAAVPDGPAKRGGVEIGSRTADAMIAARRDDGFEGNEQWRLGTEPGQWRPTPPTFASTGAWIGSARPFLVPNAAMFRTDGPPALTSRAYARDFNEVKQVGSANSTVRTQDQTEAAIWWHDRNVTLWEIKRQLAETQRLDVLQTARLFALTDTVTADQSIACYDDKRRWGFWRPVTAVREAGTDGNPRTEADPEWTPLLVTPPFPDHPSGHACATAAQMTTYRFFFGRDRVAFHAYSIASGTTRHFGSFSQALDELVSARVWGGIHFRSADVQGAKLGTAVSKHITARYFTKR